MQQDLDSGFGAEPVIGPAKRPDPLAPPRNDEFKTRRIAEALQKRGDVACASIALHRRDGFSAIAALPALVTFQLITVGSAGFSGSMSFLR
jgi:hypothetical protein